MKMTLKYHLLLTAFIFSSTLGISQDKTLGAPARFENTYLFEILKYEREPELPPYLREGIERFLAKPMTEWTAEDSLYFAYENVYLKKYEKAFNNFVRLNTDTIYEKNAQILYRTALFQMGKYEILKEYNIKTIREDKSQFYNIRDAFMDLTNAYINYRNKAFDADSSLVFPVLKDKTLKTFNRQAPPHKNKLVEVAFAIDSVLRQFTILHDNKDYILSRAFEEMGDFQKEYLYITNSYFYYSAALRYDKGNRSVIPKYNHTNREIKAKGYIHISFKSKFGKVIKNRYRLKDNYIEERPKPVLSEESYIPPQEEKQKKDYLPWMNTTALIIIIVSGALVFVLFFLKTED